MKATKNLSVNHALKNFKLGNTISHKNDVEYVQTTWHYESLLLELSIDSLTFYTNGKIMKIFQHKD